MKKEASAKCWFGNCDGPKSWCEAKIREMAQRLDIVRIIGAYHKGSKGENPHFHFLLELQQPIQKQSFDKWFKAVCEIEGRGNKKNKSWSSKEWDGDATKGATGYLFHEDEECVMFNRGFTEAQLAAAKEANKAVQAVVAINNERASVKMVDKALTYFDNQAPTRLQILTYFLKMIKSGENYHPGTFLLKRYVEEVEIKLLCEDDMDRYAMDLESQLWR